ncbi:hypothetical protein QJ48_05600 [Paenibacillus sp. A3]|nr:hypothetical protein QJ48_05600 [Paenibacillus sp. A3]
MLDNKKIEESTQIALFAELDGGSTSTIRNHRFTLREKKKQAKLFLAIMELSQPKAEPPDRA